MRFVNYFSYTGTGSVFTVHILLWDFKNYFSDTGAGSMFTVHVLLWDLNNYFFDTGTGSVFTVHILLWDFKIYFSHTGTGSMFTVHVLLLDLIIISLIQALVLCSLFTFYYGILSAASPSYLWILILRGLVGFGIGGAPQA